MIEITDKRLCCGCGACAALCPKGCLSMKSDEEGFLYPQIDKDDCINCGICLNVCPVRNPVKKEKVAQKGYLVQHRDESIRLQSSSGGAFSAIASYVLEKEGVVFGAAYDKTFRVIHRYVETTEELAEFRNSKYVQSFSGECMKQVKAFLEMGRWVCFSGTPCQVEGLAKYLGKPYDRLILVDVVCHGIGSPLIWRKYLEYQRTEEKKIDQIRFRDKYYGYKYSTMSFFSGGRNLYHAGAQMDPMLRAFFSNICDRPSCYYCPYKTRYRVSDMTIWDCFSVYDFDREMDDDKGTSRVLCHSEKGIRIMENVGFIAVCKEIEPERLIKGVKEMFECIRQNPNRSQFFIDAADMTGAELFEKYFPVTFLIRLKTAVRGLLVTTGLYGFTKKLLNKVRGR